jgi:hypothetical protein
MSWKPFRNVFVFISLLSGYILFAQETAPAPSAPKGPKLCVAAVGNGSMQPIFVNEVHEKLTKELLAAGLNAAPTSSASLVAKSLELSGNNKDSIRLRKCEYMLLTVVDAKPKGTVPAASSGGDLLLSFALFKGTDAKPLLDTAVEAPKADTPTHSILAVTDKEAERVVKVFAKTK